MRRLISMLIIVLICYTVVNMEKINNTNNDLRTTITKQEIINENITHEQLNKLNEAKEGKQDKINELESIEQWNKEIVDLMQ